MVIRIEADPVVIDRQLNEGAQPQAHGHMAGAGVLLHVSQGFLENAVERQLGVGGQPRGQPRAGQLDGHAGPIRELRAGGAQGGDQTQLVQYTGPQITRDALHFFGRPAEHLAESSRLSLQWPVARGKFFLQRLAAKEGAAKKLGDVVVQFEGHAPALGFLHLHHAVRQGPQPFLVVPGLGHVRHHQADGCTVETILGQ